MIEKLTDLGIFSLNDNINNAKVEEVEEVEKVEEVEDKKINDLVIENAILKEQIKNYKDLETTKSVKNTEVFSKELKEKIEVKLAAINKLKK